VTNEHLLKTLIDNQLSTDEILAELARQDQATKYADRNLAGAHSAMDKVTRLLITATTYTGQWIRHTGGIDSPRNSN
jgi:hypothetical protein